MFVFVEAGFALSYFLNCSSELVAPIVEEASLLFLGVVIKFFLEEVLSLSVAWVESWLMSARVD